MDEVTVVATLTVKSDFQAELIEKIKSLVNDSRAEEGCLQYDLHQDQDNPLIYIFIERWASQAKLETHAQSQHFISFEQFTKGKVEALDIRLMNRMF